MHIIPFFPQAIEEASTVLRAGGCVIHRTETCYGIACDLTNPTAVAHLFAVKKRPVHQPVSALFSSMEHVKEYVQFSPFAESIATKYLPGPLTIILPLRSDAPKKIEVTAMDSSSIRSRDAASRNEIGVRISLDSFATDLVRAFGTPIATTSANLHGLPNPYDIATILNQWNNHYPKPDLVIDSGVLPVAKPSTVIRIVDDHLEVIRQGSIVFPDTAVSGL